MCSDSIKKKKERENNIGYITRRDASQSEVPSSMQIIYII